VAEEVGTDAGTVRNVAFVPDATTPFGTCPTGAPLLDGVVESVVSGTSAPTIVVQITGAYRTNGATRVPYRLFRVDPGAVFGLTELGTGIGRWDGASRRIVVSDALPPRFPTDVDLGDDSIVIGSDAFLWGCPIPGYLTRMCILGRVNAVDTVQLFEGNGQWAAGARSADPVRVFVAGPWISSVTADSARGGLLHVFTADFGSTLQFQRQAELRPEGSWSDPDSLASCDLPPSDPAAFCMGPVVHTELADPTRPSELVVSYDVKTTASSPLPGADPYWPRLAWIAER
jgi:hypothetical protein